jgi:hypothetical protein
MARPQIALKNGQWPRASLQDQTTVEALVEMVNEHATALDAGGGGGGYPQISDDGTTVTIGTGGNTTQISPLHGAALTYHQVIEKMAVAPVGGNPGQEQVQRTVQVTSAAVDGSVQGNETIMDGSVLCNGVDRSVWGIESHVVTTRAATSTGRLANIAFLSNAYNGGDSFIDAYSFYSDNGTLRNVGAATLGPTTCDGLTVRANVGSPFAVNFSAAGAITLNNAVSGFQVPAGTVTIGQSSTVNDGTQIQTKNYSAAAADCGISVGIDTTVLSNARGGLFVFRGASGGFGGSNEAGFVFAGGANNYVVGASAGDLCLFNTTPGKRMIFSSDGTGFTTGAQLDASGNFTAKAGLQVGGTSGPKWTSGAGSPNGVVTGSPGDLYTNTSGGANTTLYVKESGAATNTGWVAK